MGPLVVMAGGRRARRLLLLTACLILGMLGLGAVEAHAATPSSLAGEAFASQRVQGSTFTGACGTEGGNFSFSVGGTATGPFPGTFTESGSFSFDRQGRFTKFSSTFTITSTAGTVTGTGSLPENHGPIPASCVFGGGGTDVQVVGLVINYSATIPGGGQDTGTAAVNMLGDLESHVVSLSETFGSGGVGGPPPTSKDQCKHGGWKSFGSLFKNQGDCLSFVATAGKNPPGGEGSKPSAQYTVCQDGGCPYDDLQNAIAALEKGTITNPITMGPGDYPNTNIFVNEPVVIRGVGDGSDGTILDGSRNVGNGSVIIVEKGGSLTVSGVAITNGTNVQGGGIANEGSVIFDGPVAITNNAASDGGGIFNDGGTVTFDHDSNVSIADNSAAIAGGGIFNRIGTVTFDAGSTVSITGNTPDGISNDNATVTFVAGSNVSITGNTPENCFGTTSCP